MPDSAPALGVQFEDLVNTGEKTTIWVSCLIGKCGEDQAVPAVVARPALRQQRTVQ